MFYRLIISFYFLFSKTQQVPQVSDKLIISLLFYALFFVSCRFIQLDLKLIKIWPSSLEIHYPYLSRTSDCCWSQKRLKIPNNCLAQQFTSIYRKYLQIPHTTIYIFTSNCPQMTRKTVAAPASNKRALYPEINAIK